MDSISGVRACTGCITRSSNNKANIEKIIFAQTKGAVLVNKYDWIRIIVFSVSNLIGVTIGIIIGWNLARLIHL